MVQLVIDRCELQMWRDLGVLMPTGAGVPLRVWPHSFFEWRALQSIVRNRLQGGTDCPWLAEIAHVPAGEKVLAMQMQIRFA
jgi:hypothetical protein